MSRFPVAQFNPGLADVFDGRLAAGSNLCSQTEVPQERPGNMSHNGLPRVLKFLRASSGLTQERVAERLNCSTSLIAKFETGRLIPMPDTAKQLDELFSSESLIRETAAEARQATPPEWFRPWPDVEAEAQSLRWFEPLVIPGLLQTESYMRELLAGGKLTEDEAVETIEIRIARQVAAFDRPNPPMFTAIICENALRQASSETVSDQLKRLTDVGQQTRTQVLVLPDNSSLHAGLSGPFVIAAMPGGERVGYVDDQLQGRVVTDPKEVVRLERAWDAVSGLALPVGRSRELITKVMDEYGRAGMA